MSIKEVFECYQEVENKEAILKEFREKFDIEHGLCDCSIEDCKNGKCWQSELQKEQIKFISDLLDKAEAEKAEAFNQGKIQGLMEAKLPDKYVCTTS